MRPFLLIVVSSWMAGCSAPDRDLSGLRKAIGISGLNITEEMPSGNVLSMDWIPKGAGQAIELRAAHDYVLVRRHPFDHEYFAEQVFPALLQSEGFEIVSRPTKEAGYTKLFIGGPVYKIEFSKHSRQYRLSVRYTPQGTQMLGLLSEVFILSIPR